MKNRFTRDNDIVTDNKNNLMWQDDSSVNERTTLEEANNTVEKANNLGGYTDWRIPNISELLSIADKNIAPNLNEIFKYRPFALISNTKEDEDTLIKTVFYDNNIVPLIPIIPLPEDSSLFFRYVRDIAKTNDNDYNTDIIKLKCDCKDWKLSRSEFSIDDPRILCKHLIRELDIDNLSDELKRYKQEIEFYKNKSKGFFDNFNTIYDIEDTSYKLLYKNDFEWMSLFDIDGSMYGIMRDEYNRIIWTHKYGKPADYLKVELFISNLPKVEVKTNDDTCDDDSYYRG